MEFTGPDGQWCSFEESTWGKALIAAIQKLPSERTISIEKYIRKARLIWDTADIARDAELPRNQDASQKVSERELERFYTSVMGLIGQIEGMHQPAISALFQEGTRVFDQLPRLHEMAQHAREAFTEVSAGNGPRGRPQKIKAHEVKCIAAFIFEDVTGKRPTFTTDPKSGRVSGKWPEFLGEVFAALGIDASVASQVRLPSEEMQ